MDDILSKDILEKRKIRYSKEKQVIKKSKRITESGERIIWEGLNKLGYM